MITTTDPRLEARTMLLAAREQHRRGTHAHRNLTDALDHLDNGRLRAAARYAAAAVYVGAEPGRITDALLVLGAELRVEAEVARTLDGGAR